MVHHVWSYIRFAAETLIFILTGIIMGQRARDESSGIGGLDYILVVGTYVGLHVIRFFIFLLCWPLLRVIGYGMDFKQLILCSYTGLRGALGMCLALLVAADDKIPKYSKDIILLNVLGVALLTLIINATTTGTLVNYLGLSKERDIRQNMLVSMSYQLDKNMQERIEVLKTKQHFEEVDWNKISKDLELNNLRKGLEKFKNLEVIKDHDIESEINTK